MFPAVLTTILFSVSILFASKSARLVGPMQANVSRLLLAMFLLGIWAHGWGMGFGGAGLPWFLLSGLVGFGLGDICMFGALSCIGPRLTILLTQCLAAPIATVGEYLLLGTRPATGELLLGGIILLGVGIALAPDKHWEGAVSRFRFGILLGVGSAFGQAFGAVFSRRGYAACQSAHVSIDGGTVAYQRISAGVLTTLLFWGILTAFGKSLEIRHPQKVWAASIGYIVFNALAGPTLGVACFQWALMVAPSVQVLPIVATAPLLTMVLAWVVEGTQPTRRTMIGATVAVTGAAGLAWMQSR
jgi:drug/metabolite transporter (DMT)-like permease